MPKVSIGQYSELSGYISGKRINRKASEREKKENWQTKKITKCEKHDKRRPSFVFN